MWDIMKTWLVGFVVVYCDNVTVVPISFITVFTQGHLGMKATYDWTFPIRHQHYHPISTDWKKL